MQVLKIILLLCACTVGAIHASAQSLLYSKGVRFFVGGGSFVHVVGGVEVENGGEATRPSAGFLHGEGNASLTLRGHLINNNDTLLSVNEGKNARVGQLRFNFEGDSTQEIKGTTPIHFAKIGIVKTDSQVVFRNHAKVLDTVFFTSGNFNLHDQVVELREDLAFENAFLFHENDSSRFFDERKGKGYLFVDYSSFNPENNQSIQGLGITFDANGGANFGDTRIRRGHGKQGGPLLVDGGPGDGSILRFFDVETSASSEVSTSVKYFDAELDSLEENGLTVWHSKKNNRGYGSIWEKEERMQVAPNELMTDLFLMSQYRFTLAPYNCENPPQLALKSDTFYLCNGDSLLLDPGSLGARYNWSSGDTTATIFVTQGGWYSVVVKDVVGCVSEDSAFVIETSNPVASVFPIIPVCQGDTTRFIDQSTAAYTFTRRWDFGESAFEGDTSIEERPSYVYTQPGTFQVRLDVTDLVGCVDDTTVEVLVSPVPQVGFVASDACRGDNIQFQSTTSISSGGFSLQWDFGDGTTSSELNPIHTYTANASYTVVLIATSGAMCSDTTEIPLNIFPRPEALFNYNTTSMCIDSVIIFQNTTANKEGVAFEWLFGDGMGAYDSIVPKVFREPGAYTVQLVASTNTFCGDTAREVILINRCQPDVDCSIDSPVVDLGADTSICEGEHIVLRVSDSSWAIKWNNLSIATELIATNKGRYSVEVVNELGCASYDEMELDVTMRHSVSLGADQFICGSGNAVINALVTPTNQLYTLLWNGLNQGGNSFIASSSGSYVVSVFDQEGCGFEARDTIHVYPFSNPPKAQFLVFSTLTVGERAEFIQLAGSDMDSYLWDFGDLTTSEEPSPIHAYVLPSVYNVTLTVRKGGCEDAITKQVKVSLPSSPPLPDTGENGGNTITRVLDVPTPRLYPVPTKGVINYELTWNGEESVLVEVILYDVFGRVVEHKQTEGKEIKLEFDLSSRDSGFYFVKTVLPVGSNVTRISKE